LRINGHRIQRQPGDIHADMMRMFETGTFDIAHLEPWLRALVVKAD
jgi:death-on-curing protein